MGCTTQVGSASIFGARIEELERLAGKLSLELEVAKKALMLLPRTKPPGKS